MSTSVTPNGGGAASSQRNACPCDHSLKTTVNPGDPSSWRCECQPSWRILAFSVLNTPSVPWTQWTGTMCSIKSGSCRRVCAKCPPLSLLARWKSRGTKNDGYSSENRFQCSWQHYLVIHALQSHLRAHLHRNHSAHSTIPKPSTH